MSMNTTFTFVPLRRATQDDMDALEATAMAFIVRHKLGRYFDRCDLRAPAAALDWWLLTRQETAEGHRLDRLWRRIKQRAIGDTAIAFNYVGHWRIES
jgi:hypothetical protein